MTDRLEIKDGQLFIDGCSTVELAEKYGTPLYVYSENDIRDRFRQLRECFTEMFHAA